MSFLSWQGAALIIRQPLTTLSTQQIVAEFGYTRAAIKAAIGVTPTTMRPPRGDIDDRVRAIALAMGLVPIIWTNEGGQSYDTFGMYSQPSLNHS